MFVKSKNTTKVHEISPEAWKKMQDKGDARHYTVVNEAQGAHETARNSVVSADYGQLLKNAAKAAKDGRDDEAIAAYEQALAIKTTPMVEKKLAELQNKEK